MSDNILTFPSILHTVGGASLSTFHTSLIMYGYKQVSSPNVILALVLGASICYLLPFLFRKNIVDKDGNPIPPGPLFRYFCLRVFPEVALDGWAKRFGPLFSLWMGNQLYVVISDPHIARDIFVNNGAIFSSRKDYFIKNQSILRGRAITASQYNDKW